MSRLAATAPVFWAAPILHPLPLAAALVLAINDHWLKGAGLLPAAMTGKLSDICGLFFFPALLLALWRGALALRGRPVRRDLLAPLVAVLLTGTVFAAANLSGGFNGWLGGWWGHKVMDPSDLATLPALLASWLWLRRCDAEQAEQEATRPRPA